MLSRRREYDAALESFSAPLMLQVPYALDAEGRMTVDGDTVDLYRHPDLTPMVEAMWRWLEIAVDEELPAELDLLVSLARARRALRAVVDMPDRLEVLFIRLCRQNDGRLSRRSRASHFSMLSDEEVERMEAAVREAFHLE